MEIIRGPATAAKGVYRTTGSNVRNLLKERLEHVNGIEKLRSTVRQDIFDENHFLQQYPIAFEAPATLRDLKLIDMAVGPPQTLRHRPSIDLVQAAKAARQDIWRATAAPTLHRMASVDTIRTKAKPALDLMEAANSARLARGERLLPVRTSSLSSSSSPLLLSPRSPSSSIQYSVGRPSTSHSNYVADDLDRRGGMGRAEAIQRSQSVSGLRRTPTTTSTQMQFDRSRPSTAGSTRSIRSAPSSYRRIGPPPPPPPKDYVQGEYSIAEMASKFPLPAKSPPSSVKSPSPSIRSFSTMSPVPSRSHSRRSTRTSSDSHAFSSFSNSPPNEIQILPIVTSDGELHERYRTNTEDTEYTPAKIVKPVIHEDIVPTIHHISTTEISRHHHTHEHRHHIQPVLETEYEPEKHWVQTTDGQFVEISMDELERLKNRYKYATRIDELAPTSSKGASPPLRSYTWKPRTAKDVPNRTRGHSA
ncbi:hypothetical protein TWF696_006940 [Orbilia brochopaga]|uniref:Uncharacterized protein n=1 Tax=Orbilia brochopaga TaxID=3140254 RepID=A0AAV9UUM7_9PEZI